MRPSIWRRPFDSIPWLIMAAVRSATLAVMGKPVPRAVGFPVGSDRSGSRCGEAGHCHHPVGTDLVRADESSRHVRSRRSCPEGPFACPDRGSKHVLERHGTGETDRVGYHFFCVRRAQSRPTDLDVNHPPTRNPRENPPRHTKRFRSTRTVKSLPGKISLASRPPSKVESGVGSPKSLPKTLESRRLKSYHGSLFDRARTKWEMSVDYPSCS